jgi:hypothetical protein
MYDSILSRTHEGAPIVAHAYGLDGLAVLSLDLAGLALLKHVPNLDVVIVIRTKQEAPAV